MRSALLLSLGLLLGSMASPARAGGLYLPDPGVIAQGRGCAYVATSDELIGAFYNPAGLHQIDGLYIHAGGAWVKQHLTFQRAGGEGYYKPFLDDEFADDPDDIEAMLGRPFEPVDNLGWQIVPDLGIAYGLDDPDLTFGLAAYAPVAPKFTFPEDGAQRYARIDSIIWQAHVSAFLSIRVAPFLAIGISGGYMLLRVMEDFAASSHAPSALIGYNDENPLFDVQVHQDAWDKAHPWINGGVLVMPAPWLRIGASFSPGFRLDANAVMSMKAEIEAVEGQPLTIDTSDEMVLYAQVPPILRTGVAVIPRQGLEFELDFHVELWSTAREMVMTDIDVDLSDVHDQIEALAPGYDEQVAELVSDLLADSYRGIDGKGNADVSRLYQDSWSLRFGVEGDVKPWMALRGGCLFERAGLQSPFVSAQAPDADKFGLSFGLTVGPPGFDIHLSWMHYFFATRTITDGALPQFVAFEGIPPNVTNNGTYRSQADIVGLAISVRGREIKEAREAKRAAR